MNRKERRAAVAASAEVKTFSKSDVEKMRSLCIWGGCDANTPTHSLEPGWRHLITYQGNKAPKKVAEMLATGRGIERDAVLCPHHAEELESLLKSIPRPMGDPLGSA